MTLRTVIYDVCSNSFVLPKHESREGISAVSEDTQITIEILGLTNCSTYLEYLAFLEREFHSAPKGSIRYYFILGELRNHHIRHPAKRERLSAIAVHHIVTTIAHNNSHQAKEVIAGRLLSLGQIREIYQRYLSGRLSRTLYNYIQDYTGGTT